MALRGTKPQERKQRLKMFMFGPAGVGKTTAAIQMPRPYIIDTEAGSTHYGDTMDETGGVVFESSNYDEVIQEVRTLATEQHDYLTLVIDPITHIYADLLDEGEKKVGDDFGKHYAYANKRINRLISLITAIDMNVVVTSHEKDEYANIVQPNGKKEMTKVGKTFDAYKKMDYIFDLVLQLERDRETRQRFATVIKTRLSDSFPDLDRFEWKYETIVDRFGAEKLEKGVETVEFGTPEQVERFKYLMSQLPEDMQAKIEKTSLKGVGDVADLPRERLEKGIAGIEAHLQQNNLSAV